MKSKKLSIVIITRNEEANINACLKEANKINFIKKEIILIDSNSTDRTIDIAKKYPINIIKIIKSNIYSPSAGRKIGLSHARGDFILFLDGDQIINLIWLKKYISLLDKDYFDLVSGKNVNVPPNAKIKLFKKITTSRPVGRFCNKFPGSFLIKNSKVLKEESFDPFMRGEEERDFAYRLIKRGYKIYKSKEDMALHLLKKEDILEIKEHIKYTIGIGQIIKKHLFSRFFLEILKDFRMFFIISFGILILIYLFIFSRMKYLGFLLILLAIIILLIKNKSKINSLFSLSSIKLILIPMKVIQGIFIEFLEKKNFKYKIKIIKWRNQ